MLIKLFTRDMPINLLIKIFTGEINMLGISPNMLSYMNNIKITLNLYIKNVILRFWAGNLW